MPFIYQIRTTQSVNGTKNTTVTTSDPFLEYDEMRNAQRIATNEAIKVNWNTVDELYCLVKVGTSLNSMRIVREGTATVRRG